MRNTVPIDGCVLLEWTVSGHFQEVASCGRGEDDVTCSRDEMCVLISLATAHSTSPLNVPVRAHTSTCVYISYVPAQSVFNAVHPYSNALNALTAAGLVAM